jgi:hypothetical protein
VERICGYLKIKATTIGGAGLQSAPAFAGQVVLPQLLENRLVIKVERIGESCTPTVGARLIGLAAANHPNRFP